jgi:hypothetical protein
VRRYHDRGQQDAFSEYVLGEMAAVSPRHHNAGDLQYFLNKKILPAADAARWVRQML